MNNKIVLTYHDIARAKKFLREEYEKRHPSEVYWTTKDGTEINIKDMSDDHILKTLNLLSRHEEYNDMIMFSDMGDL